MTRSISLFRVADNQFVEATLMPVTNKHLEDAKNYWEPQLLGTGAEDEYWDWQRKSRWATILPGGELYAIECLGMTQGLLTINVLKKRCQIDSQYRKRLVYIEAIASAPWNRPKIVNPPQYKGVGTILVNFAILRSEELGYKGRIGLHSLPGALDFYRKLRIGLVDCDPDPDEPDNLIYFQTIRYDS